MRSRSPAAAACGANLERFRTAISFASCRIVCLAFVSATQSFKMSGKKCWIGGNFKAAATKSIVQAQVDLLNKIADFPSNAEVVIAPSTLHIASVQGTVRPEVAIAVQDIHSVKGLGAYTGSHTIDQVKDVGIPWVLIGHSERRSIWAESDAGVASKAKLTVEAGLKPIVCVGETLTEREGGHTLDVCFRQLQAVADVLSPEQWAHLVVAYEPVWAIGTGKVATKEQAQEVHAAIRNWLSEKVSPAVSAATRIVYGGSVNAANCVSLISEKDIDGFLVGGASLKPEFADIIKSVSAKA